MALSAIWRRGRVLLGLAISAAFVAITIARVDPALMGRAWANVILPFLGIAVAISLLEVGVRAARWHGLLRPLAATRYPTVYAMLCIGHLANAILPARLGDVARALIAGSRLRISRTSALGTIAVERVADAALLSVAAAVGILVGYRSLSDSLVVLVTAGAAAGTVAGIAILLLRQRRISTTYLGSLALHHGRRFALGASALRTPAQAARVALLTVGSFGLAVLILMTGASAVGLPMSVWQAALVMAVVTLSTAIPAGPASVGTYEFVGMSVLVSMGYPSEESLLAIALVHAVVVMTPAVVGLASLWAMGIHPLASRFGTRAGVSA